MGSRSAARSPRNNKNQNERIDVEGLENFFLDDHKDLLAKGLNLKEAVYYYGDSKSEIREKISNGEIPAIRIPDPEGPKWCIFPDGVPQALKHLIPVQEEVEVKQAAQPESVSEQKNKAPKRKSADAAKIASTVTKVEQVTKQTKTKAKVKAPSVHTEEVKAKKPEPLADLRKRAESKLAKKPEATELIVPPLGILTGVIEGNIADFKDWKVSKPAPMPAAPVEIAIGPIPASEILDIVTAELRDLRSWHTEQLCSHLSAYQLPKATRQQVIVIESEQDFEQFPSTDWPSVSYKSNLSLQADPYYPRPIVFTAPSKTVIEDAESEAPNEIVHNFIISDATPNSFSLPLGSILEALIPTLDFLPSSSKDESEILTVTSSPAEQTSFSAFSAIKLEQPELDALLSRMEEAALNAVDPMPRKSAVVAEVQSQVWVSEDTALPIIPSLRRADREEASRKRAERTQDLDISTISTISNQQTGELPYDISEQLAPNFERVADVIQKVTELEKALREAHYKNNYLEARLTGMEDQLKYLSQNNYSSKSWNTYAIIIFSLLSALAVIATRLLS